MTTIAELRKVLDGTRAVSDSYEAGCHRAEDGVNSYIVDGLDRAVQSLQSALEGWEEAERRLTCYRRGVKEWDLADMPGADVDVVLTDWEEGVYRSP